MRVQCDRVLITVEVLILAFLMHFNLDSINTELTQLFLFIFFFFPEIFLAWKKNCTHTRLMAIGEH